MSLFIAVEGIEGVGKSTMIKVVTSHLEAKGQDYIHTREPGGSNLAEEIRGLLKSSAYQTDAKTELLLMFAARSHHVKHVILPALEQGTAVVSDRFVAASYAYQGGGRMVQDEIIRTLDDFVCDKHPDLTLLITCPVDVAIERIHSRGEAIDRIESESIAFFERAQAKYISLANDDPSYAIIDGSKQQDEVALQIQKILEERV